MNDLAFRVAALYKAQRSIAAGTVNSEYWSLSWSKTKWTLQEMADGSRIPGLISWGENPGIVLYEMPVQEKSIANISHQHVFRIDPDSIRREARLMATDKGPEARQKLVEAYDRYLKDLAESIRTNVNGYYNTSILQALESVIPQILKKAKWKKVA